MQTLLRLAELAEGEELTRVEAAIAARRRELALEGKGSALWDAPPAPRERRWKPGATPFTPAPRDAVPTRVRRPGEKGYRIVGVRSPQ